ncbi:hypothetical protein ACOSQ3_010247 [Xanthoceras sorbifolium]
MPEEEDLLPLTSNSISLEEVGSRNWRQRRLDAPPPIGEALELLNQGQDASPRSYASVGSVIRRHYRRRNCIPLILTEETISSLAVILRRWRRGDSSIICFCKI